MADEYIRMEDAINALEEKEHEPWYLHKDLEWISGVVEAKYEIKAIEPADVVPVIHAYWEGEEADCNIKCHKCGKVFRDYIISQDYVDLSEYPDFCPHCGAKMDREE